MATAIDTSPRIAWATAATEDILWIAEHHGGAAGQELARQMPYGPGQSMGELEYRLALGALSSAQRAILERLEAQEGADKRGGVEWRRPKHD